MTWEVVRGRVEEGSEWAVGEEGLKQVMEGQIGYRWGRGGRGWDRNRGKDQVESNSRIGEWRAEEEKMNE